MGEDGFIFVVDRVKDMSLRGGYNIYPREVEEIIYKHPAVTEVAAVGVPHERVRHRGGGGHPCQREGRRLQIPALRDIRSDLPKTATGKILKREPPGSSKVESDAAVAVLGS